MAEKYGQARVWQLSLRRSASQEQDALVIKNPISASSNDLAFCTMQIDRGRSEIELIRSQREFIFIKPAQTL